MLKKILLPLILSLLLIAFWFSSDFQEIAAGVAVFLFGMLMLEDGFKLFSGGFLEKILARATGSTSRSISFGILTTTLMQSSSLVSVITISFLSAGLISLIAGVGIIFGANIGTTTGAWLVAGFGLKVKISAYAMPMLAVAIVLVFQRNKYWRGAGYVLAGLGFLFLGIHFMKEGFEAFKDQFDLTRFAMSGILGLIVYTLVGSAATVVMQSSHATMVLILTGLSAGQISYANALALAIGANIGTTITAIIGSLTANYQGKRLALAHLIFNLVTASVALVFINQLRQAVDFVSLHMGIADTDYALKLAVFHTIFNVLGVAIMLPLMNWLIAFLTQRIAEPKLDISKPKYLNEAVDAFPATIELALRKEVLHLQENAVELIAHGLNIHRHQLYSSNDIARTVQSSRSTFELDIGARYEARVKTLYSAIVDFTSRVGDKDIPHTVLERAYRLRNAATAMVRAVKAIKHMRRNANLFTSKPMGAATDLYNTLRTEIARILAQLHALNQMDEDSRDSAWLEEELAKIKKAKNASTQLVEAHIRAGDLEMQSATSFLNDSDYAYNAMKDLLKAAKAIYSEPESTEEQVERILKSDESGPQLGKIMAEQERDGAFDVHPV
ncbi:phosphate:Na+ symporter [Cohaesibacter marisflavi]|uniref:Phosphate:Na+ symporter n=1 Tax=Cohaesibacter marisflavi TaxID=655353 RepID=A0A1I5LP44_9HYPH|nr:Na/Pi symporter [Cohaesibacter marisflavi]SFO99078.1 phosphate:Na+ symporter [Cohaesibacter marisflavi]